MFSPVDEKHRLRFSPVSEFVFINNKVMLDIGNLFCLSDSVAYFFRRELYVSRRRRQSRRDNGDSSLLIFSRELNPTHIGTSLKSVSLRNYSQLTYGDSIPCCKTSSVVDLIALITSCRKLAAFGSVSKSTSTRRTFRTSSPRSTHSNQVLETPSIRSIWLRTTSLGSATLSP
jgi:hypothetical protein